MNFLSDNAATADRFGVVARRFCSVVENALGMDRTDLLTQIYPLLPKLIDEAINLPDVELSDSDDQIEETGRQAPRVKTRLNVEEWDKLYNALQEKLGNWDSYRHVFDPNEDDEAIMGSLADDIADIYRDLKEGLVPNETQQPQPEEIIWKWRLLFYSHWGQHAIDALLVIHFRLQNPTP